MQKTLLPKLELIQATTHGLRDQVAGMKAEATHSGMVLENARTELDDCLRILNAGHEQPDLFGPGGAA